jgi:hypothetical protein
MRGSILMLAAFGLLLAVAPSAVASTTNFSLSTDDYGDSTPTPGSVSVTVNLISSTSATVTFNAATGYYISEAFLNVNGDFTLGTITGTQATYTSATNQGIDSFGTMSLEIQANPNKPSSTIQISLTAAGSNTWSSPLSVLTPTCPDNDSKPSCVGGYGVSSPDSGGGYNPSHYTQGFDADVLVGTSSTSSGSDNGDLAGFVTPEPASMILFGSGMLALGFFARRKKSAA